MNIMTKEEFKSRWESDKNGGGITFNDIAECAVNWGLSSHPKTELITHVCYIVLSAAGCNDADAYKPLSTSSS